MGGVYLPERTRPHHGQQQLLHDGEYELKSPLTWLGECRPTSNETGSWGGTNQKAHLFIFN